MLANDFDQKVCISPSTYKLLDSELLHYVSCDVHNSLP